MACEHSKLCLYCCAKTSFHFYKDRVMGGRILLCCLPPLRLMSFFSFRYLREPGTVLEMGVNKPAKDCTPTLMVHSLANPWLGVINAREERKRRGRGESWVDLTEYGT